MVLLFPTGVLCSQFTAENIYYHRRTQGSDMSGCTRAYYVLASLSTITVLQMSYLSLSLEASNSPLIFPFSFPPVSDLLPLSLLCQGLWGILDQPAFQRRLSILVSSKHLPTPSYQYFPRRISSRNRSAPISQVTAFLLQSKSITHTRDPSFASSRFRDATSSCNTPAAWNFSSPSSAI